MFKFFRKYIFLSLVILFGSLFLTTSASAAIRYWVGATDGANTNTTVSWSSTAASACNTNTGASVPTSADTVIFESQCTNGATINAPVNVAGVAMNTGYTGTVTQGANTVTVGASGFSQAAGTFTGGSVVITDNGDFTLTGGTFTSTSSTLFVSGTFNNTGGTFTHNGGSVMLNNITNKTLTNTQNFNNLTLNDGLVGYWKLDETSGTSAKDSSGYGNMGTLTSASIISSTVAPTNFLNPRAVSFDTTNYVNVGNDPSLNPPGDLTIAFWIKIPGTTDSGNNWAMVGKSAGCANSVNVYWMGIGNGGRVAFSTTSNGNSTGGTKVLLDQQWHHVVGTITSGTMKIYVDGVVDPFLFGNPVVPSRYTNPAATTLLGYNGVCGGASSDAAMDDVRIYNRALSANEVSVLAAGNEPATGVATTTLGGALNVVGNFQLNTGTLDSANGSNYGISVGGNWENNGGIFTPRANTVTLTSTGSKTLLSGSQGFYNLTQNGSGGTYTLQDSLTTTNTLAITSGSFVQNSKTLTLTNLTINGGNFTSPSSTLTVNGNFALSSGAFTAPSTNLNVLGNWTNSGGTFAPGTGTITLNGSNQSLSGSTTFYNLTKSVTSPDILTFSSGSTQTINAGGTLQLTGASGQALLSLRSTTPGTQANIAFNGLNQTLNFLDVKDSNASSLTLQETNSTNSGNNTNWSFPLSSAPGYQAPTVGSGGQGSLALLSLTHPNASSTISSGLSTPTIPAVPNISSPAASSPTFLRYLGRSDHGQDVLALQQLLQTLSFFPQTIQPNGYFGPATQKAVKLFQQAHHISQTGNVGPITLKALNSL